MAPASLSHHAKMLNLCKPQSLDFEWEVVVLNAVTYETSFGGSSVPDLTFASGISAAPEFVADIATVSNKGRHDANPLEFFKRELDRRIRNAGLSPNRFALRVEGSTEGTEQHQVLRLHLPLKKNADRFFDSMFDRFLASCRREPTARHDLSRHQPDLEFMVRYDPGQRYQSYSHPAFDVAYSATNNPIHNALKRKANRLRRSGATLPMGIILCEADCNLRSSVGRYTPELIVRHFLRDTSSIAFVIVLAAVVEPHIDLFRSPPREHVFSRSYISETAGLQLSASALQALADMPKCLPKPVVNGITAVRQLQHRIREGRSFGGGYRVTNNTIRVSTRTLLAYLAGRLDKPYQPGPLFDQVMERGGTIDAASVETNADLDDDWITFHIRDRDPAISPFKQRITDAPSSGDPDASTDPSV
jgi:hypothetical protein